ncbi:MAG: phosphatidate cytidylyltransferase [Bacteroidaceae bacterium]|nr:phosphatidate cytidylyltransferase [Bacteroidaceae bacterium]
MKLLVRALTGAAYVALMVFGTVFRPWTLLALIVLLALLAVWEFAHITSARFAGEPASLRAAESIAFVLLSLSAVALPVAVYAVCRFADCNDLLAFAPYLVVLLLMFVVELYARRADPLGNLGRMALAQVWVVCPLSLLSVLAFAPLQAVGRPFWALPLAVYVLLWLNDSGAYLVGSLLGRHKLFPRISPGKSWEGSVGGAVVALAAAVALAHYFPFIPLWRWLGLALVVVLFGTWGDLTESLIKRTLGLKDSGKLLPGHGGILDRIDSMLLAVPAAVAYLCL